MSNLVYEWWDGRKLNMCDGYDNEGNLARVSLRGF